MKEIKTLSSAGVSEAMLYKDKNDDGLFVKFSHGRMDWYRADNGYFIDIYNYSYWE